MSQIEIIAGIDIGANGGLVAKRMTDGKIFSFKPKDYLEAFKRFQGRSHIVYVEKLHAFPGMAVNTVWAMAQEQGRVIGLIEATGINSNWLSAITWQKPLELPKKQEYKVRKQNLINKAKELYPHELVYAWKADALLIMDYAVKMEESKAITRSEDLFNET